MQAITSKLDPSLPLGPPSTALTGPMRLHHLGEELGLQDMYINVVYYGAGTRTRPHVHDCEQVLYYQGGAGVVALAGGEDQRIEAGAAVVLPAGVVHMHGAASDGPAWHMSIMPHSGADFSIEIPASWRKWTLEPSHQ